MEPKSEKDTLLNSALDEIMTVQIEGKLINGDHLKYWDFLEQNIINISSASFRAGIKNFYNAISMDSNKKELVNYNFRILTRLCNSEVVLLAIENLYNTFSEMILEKNELEIEWDMISGTEVFKLTKFEKVFLLMHIYQDIINTSYNQHLKEYLKTKVVVRKGFKV